MRIFRLLLPFFLLIRVACVGEDAGDLRSFGTAGKQETTLTTEHETTLFTRKGAGCLTHMWFGGGFPNDDKTRVRVYVDGEREPSIDMELFMGTGIGFGDRAAPWGSEKMGRTGEGQNVYNTYRIPFSRGVRVTAQLAPGTKEHPMFWWIIHGTENLRVHLGGVTLPRTARLRLYRVDDHAAQPLDEVQMCDVRGAGALYEVAIAAAGSAHTGKYTDYGYMEGCVRAYLNGSREPTLLSSGFEDYFLGTYYFNRGRYATAISGLTHLGNGEVSAYRFHDADPLFFQDGLKLTVRCGEKLGDREPWPKAPPTTYTTYVWLYRW